MNKELKDHIEEKAEKIKEEIEELMLMKSIIMDAKLKVCIINYTWCGHINVYVGFDGEEYFRIEVDDRGYRFIASNEELVGKIKRIIYTNRIFFKTKTALLLMIKKHVI